MATPLTADRLIAALKAEGVKVAEHPGWRDHERDAATGRTFGPVHGITIHHTAGRDSLALCWNGTADLPGPLCHTHLAKTGLATMLSAGRANHAGTFAQNAHDAVLAEAAIHPRPDAAEPVDGNDAYYGIEIENLGNGEDPYPGTQYDAAVRWAAAICRAHGWTENSVIGHKEGTRRKIDPSFDMNVFRASVAARLAHDAGWNSTQEDDVALTDADAEKIARKALTLDGVIANPNTATAKDNPYISLATAVRNNEIVARRTEAAVNAHFAGLLAAVSALAEGGGLSAAEIQAAAEAGAKAALDQLGDALTKEN